MCHFRVDNEIIYIGLAVNIKDNTLLPSYIIKKYQSKFTNYIYSLNETKLVADTKESLLVQKTK